MSSQFVPQPEELFTITGVTAEFDVTARTLRHYEEIGLISPLRRGSQRLYTVRDRVRIRLILRGRRLGFALGEIHKMLDLYDADPTEVTQLREVIQRGDDKLQELSAQVAELQEVITELVELRAKMKIRLDAITAEEEPL